MFKKILSYFKSSKSHPNVDARPYASLNNLADKLRILEHNNAEFKFVGITTNGNDCLYFIFEKGKFQIEYEAISQVQINYLKVLKDYAKQQGWETFNTSYGNMTDYDQTEAPVLRIFTYASISQTIEIADDIQQNVFGNPPHTKFEIVP